MAPIVKKPKRPAAFPPAGHLRAYRVRDGDNWWTLQKRFGLRDPWSLIRYNFATDDPAEVNWYLREYVGCAKATADGKNYCFSGAARPGLLYLPRHNFKRGIGGGGLGGGTCDEGAEQQPQKDEAAERTVLWALGLPALGSVQFEINGFGVSPFDYQRVRRLIQEGEIVVAHNASLAQNAAYAPVTDSIYLGKRADRTPAALSVIIHEATHAAFDAGAVKINDATSEMIAYVAQMLFIMTRDPKAEPPIYDLPAERDIFLPAWRVAKRIRAKQQSHPEPVYSTTAGQDQLAMIKALVAHPTYRDQFACADAYYDGSAGYNGVKGWVYNWVE